MSNYLTSVGVKASGTIYPSRFVMGDVSTDRGVVQAAGVAPLLIGVSQATVRTMSGLAGIYNPPETGAIGPAAIAGEPIGIFLPGDVCGLVVGSGTVTRWDMLTTDGDGKALTATSNQKFGAVALESGTAGSDQIIDVLVGWGKV